MPLISKNLKIGDLVRYIGKGDDTARLLIDNYPVGAIFGVISKGMGWVDLKPMGHDDEDAFTTYDTQSLRRCEKVVQTGLRVKDLNVGDTIRYCVQLKPYITHYEVDRFRLGTEFKVIHIRQGCVDTNVVGQDIETVTLYEGASLLLCKKVEPNTLTLDDPDEDRINRLYKKAEPDIKIKTEPFLFEKECPRCHKINTLEQDMKFCSLCGQNLFFRNISLEIFEEQLKTLEDRKRVLYDLMLCYSRSNLYQARKKGRDVHVFYSKRFVIPAIGSVWCWRVPNFDKDHPLYDISRKRNVLFYIYNNEIYIVNPGILYTRWKSIFIGSPRHQIQTVDWIIRILRAIMTEVNTHLFTYNLKGIEINDDADKQGR